MSYYIEHNYLDELLSITCTKLKMVEASQRVFGSQIWIFFFSLEVVMVTSATSLMCCVCFLLMLINSWLVCSLKIAMNMLNAVNFGSFVTSGPFPIVRAFSQLLSCWFAFDLTSIFRRFVRHIIAKWGSVHVNNLRNWN